MGDPAQTLGFRDVAGRVCKSVHAFTRCGELRLVYTDCNLQQMRTAMRVLFRYIQFHSMHVMRHGHPAALGEEK